MQAKGSGRNDREKGSGKIHEARYYKSDFYAQSNDAYDSPSTDSTPYSSKAAYSVK